MSLRQPCQDVPNVINRATIEILISVVSFVNE